MQSRRKRVRRGDGSVYRINGKRERWKTRIVGINRRVQGSMDWTKQSVWKKGRTKGKSVKKERKNTK